MVMIKHLGGLYAGKVRKANKSKALVRAKIAHARSKNEASGGFLSVSYFSFSYMKRIPSIDFQTVRRQDAAWRGPCAELSRLCFALRRADGAPVPVAVRRP
jgi:hypothetical protein